VEDRRLYSYFILHRRCRLWALLEALVGARVREGRSVAGKEGSDGELKGRLP
jgi:hypothetical protein